MKAIVFLVTLLFVTATSFSQAHISAKDRYLQKSINQKSVGWVLLGGGTTMGVIGAVIAGQGDIFSNEFATGGMLIFGGIVSDLASIPFFISAAKNARKAAKLSFTNQRVLCPQQHLLIVKTQPALTLKIPL